MYYLTGFADEAADDINGQIRATQELGWQNMEARSVNGTYIHDLSGREFDEVYGRLQEAGVRVNCFGSAIANWAKQITEPFDSSLEEARRAIPRMRRLGTGLVRIMSFAVLEDRGPDHQMEQERFRRLRELCSMFCGAGITPVHENCMNYGGMGWKYTLKLVEHVPGLQLVFDTGNPVFNPDRSKPKPWPRQSPWEFYDHVKEHVAYIHIKDAVWNPDKGEPEYTLPGQGSGNVEKILTDLLARGYNGGISIEPHRAVVFHTGEVTSSPETRYRNYLEYGRCLELLLRSLAGKEVPA